MKTIKKTSFFPMKNPIQNFQWGSKDALTKLFDTPNPKHEPQAELWMGAHPNASSAVNVGASTTLLNHLIAQDKSAFLSSGTAQKFGELPYLFKVLAANSALSVQVHPNKQQAQQGYAKENELGIPLLAANRNYRDANHKPELVYALTSFQAMNGFRPYAEIQSLFASLTIEVLHAPLAKFSQDLTAAGLERFFVQLLNLAGEEKIKAIKQLLEYTQNNTQDPLYKLISELKDQYPGDIGLFTPLMLNVLTLAPGEAMFLHAQTPHAYLKGTALEIMANSDNVLRAGLTPKHMDIDELVDCTKFTTSHASELLNEPSQSNGVSCYSIPVDDFEFSVYHSPENQSVQSTSADILFAIEQSLTLTHESGETCTIQKGQSVFVPAYVAQYKISSKGRVAKAHY
ncbi:mannose-6-phosphate isomerase, class I [Vibrio gallicus]|uniref:mannose-6-phosphate isomerase, class I n=1 Tax=Vibrio gallicus TaxID=190897 RepID=UPI0021C378EA|nr:mannose-6-phosphate isomerase, class I [Vibrio gallicus]